jgi:hypothetical protein
MNDIEEIKLNKFREVWSMSIFFITFFGGRFYLTNEFCHFCKIRQRKIRYRTTYFNEWTYQTHYIWRYYWKTIKIE